MTVAHRTVRAPRGPEITCRSWQTEAALRMLESYLNIPFGDYSIPDLDARLEAKVGVGVDPVLAAELLTSLAVLLGDAGRLRDVIALLGTRVGLMQEAASWEQRVDQLSERLRMIADSHRALYVQLMATCLDAVGALNVWGPTNAH